ncbi:alanine--tRNA ligase [Patescibacteria group bacterium]|nr:MAG: alanine--tRNA ligase [Patescibacteria group bacterium]
MRSDEIRSRFLKFFEKRGHAIIPAAPLVPENDPSVLFNTAGMQPLVPYLMGGKHPAGTRLADSQKCVRTIDIDEVGDSTHCTFFEMLGNWSLGDYFKEDAIRWSYEFLTNKTEGLGLDPTRLYVTVFAGDENAEKDTEAFDIWKKVGVPENRIYFKGADSNWWPAVKNGKDSWTGPTGPCSEMFYDVTEKGLGDMTVEEYNQADAKQQVVEVWNDVFMEFEKKEGKIVGKLAQKNVDTGAGLERLCMVLQKTDSVFDTDLFDTILGKVNEFSISDDVRVKRIVADHIRTAVFLIGDGVLPSNTDQGYVLRRILRRAVRFADVLGMKHGSLFWLAGAVIEKFGPVYGNLSEKAEYIKKEVDTEEQKFRKTLEQGLKEFNNVTTVQLNKQPFLKMLDPQAVFRLYTSYGFPFELIVEIAKERGFDVDDLAFRRDMEAHQSLSRAGAEKKFKGGLADTDEMSLKYHTATHLLHQALRDVLGTHVQQKGSNITAERLRFDFAHTAKMTDDEKKKVEDIVNEKISAGLPMQVVELDKSEAEKVGALHFFGDKYGEKVTVYFIGDSVQTAYSKEFCGGPHVKNTLELAGPEGKWKFKIAKEEAVSAGVRRIKAVLV